jgi:hypothetical protein
MAGTIPSQVLASALPGVGESPISYTDSTNVPLQHSVLLEAPAISGEEYVRLAEQMSAYFTWDFSAAPD